MKTNLSLIGLLQALFIVVYCILVGGLFFVLGQIALQPPAFWGIALILVLFVFSAALTGSVVFGYPAYLTLNGKIKEALSLLTYTLLYIVGFVVIIIVLIVALI